MSTRWLAQLTASTFNRLGQYVSSPRYRAYCHAELAVFYPGNGRRTNTSTHLHLPTEGWPGWVDLGGWFDWDKFCLNGIWTPDVGIHPSTNQARCRPTSLMWSMPKPLRQTATMFSVHGKTKNISCEQLWMHLRTVYYLLHKWTP